MKSHILILGPLPPLNKVFPLVFQHEMSIIVGAPRTQYGTNILYASKTISPQQKTTNVYTPEHNRNNSGENNKDQHVHIAGLLAIILTNVTQSMAILQVICLGRGMSPVFIKQIFRLQSQIQM